MQTAKVMVNIGGDKGHQVPKIVTAAEIPVLMAIHGDEAVSDIEPADDVERSNREELERLYNLYGGATDGEGRALVKSVYPGAGARVFLTLGELGLHDNFYKPTARAKAVPAAVVESASGDNLQMGEELRGPKTSRKKKADAEPAPEAEAEAAVPDTVEPGEKDMGDDALFK